MYLIGNGRLLTFDPDERPPYPENGAVAADESGIIAVGDTAALRESYPSAEFIDARGGIIMPAFIDAHTHFCRRLARGLVLPGHKPSEYDEILGGRWRSFNNALTLDLCRLSAYASVIEGIHNGITTFFDLHSSCLQPSGSLMSIASALRSCGARACLSYEASDLFGSEKCGEAVSENIDFHEYVSSLNDGRIVGMFGLGSPFALSNNTLDRCVKRSGGRMGFHIQAAECAYDTFDSLHRYSARPIRRLYDAGVLSEKTLLAHCSDVNAEDIRIIRDSGCAVASCPTFDIVCGSDGTPVMNMLDEGIEVCIGSNAYAPDMFEALRHECALQRRRFGISDVDAKSLAASMLYGSGRLASRIFGVELGILKPGAEADIIVVEYSGITPLSPENFFDHILCGMSGSRCIHSMSSGRLLMRDGVLQFVDERALNVEICKIVSELWKKFI